jgi:hypothetical protein
MPPLTKIQQKAVRAPEAEGVSPVTVDLVNKVQKKFRKGKEIQRKLDSLFSLC